jgi:hypothetical protein
MCRWRRSACNDHRLRVCGGHAACLASQDPCAWRRKWLLVTHTKTLTAVVGRRWREVYILIVRTTPHFPLALIGVVLPHEHPPASQAARAVPQTHAQSPMRAYVRNCSVQLRAPRAVAACLCSPPPRDNTGAWVASSPCTPTCHHQSRAAPQTDHHTLCAAACRSPEPAGGVVERCSLCHNPVLVPRHTLIQTVASMA